MRGTPTHCVNHPFSDKGSSSGKVRMESALLHTEIVRYPKSSFFKGQTHLHGTAGKSRKSRIENTNTTLGTWDDCVQVYFDPIFETT